MKNMDNEVNYINLYEFLHEEIIKERELLKNSNFAVEQLLDIAATQKTVSKFLDNYLTTSFSDYLNKIQSIKLEVARTYMGLHNTGRALKHAQLHFRGSLWHCYEVGACIWVACDALYRDDDKKFQLLRANAS